MTQPKNPPTVREQIPSAEEEEFQSTTNRLKQELGWNTSEGKTRGFDLYTDLSEDETNNSADVAEGSNTP